MVKQGGRIGYCEDILLHFVVKNIYNGKNLSLLTVGVSNYPMSLSPTTSQERRVINGHMNKNKELTEEMVAEKDALLILQQEK